MSLTYHYCSHKDLLNYTYMARKAKLRQWHASEQTGGAVRRRIQLRVLLGKARFYTTAYREKLGGLDLSDPYAALAEAEFTTRQDLQDDLEGHSVDVPGRYLVSTGGSSGIPIQLYRTGRSFSLELAHKAILYERVGWHEGVRQMVLRGHRIDAPGGMEFVPDMHELRCSSFHLTPEYMQGYWEEANRFGVEWLRCYPSAGYLFARWLLDNGLRLNLEGVLCASEKLYGFQREAMRWAFGGRIFSHYGNYELAALAGYCEHSDIYHVDPDYGVVELIDAAGKPVQALGEIGVIVATSFIADSTLIVRYITGDMAMYGGEECTACGRRTQLWLDVEGRRNEYIVTGTGRYISPAALNEHGDLYDVMRQFQYRQRVRGEVDFLYVPRGPVTDIQAADIARRVRERLGPDVVTRIYQVAQLPDSARGKHGFLVQELDGGRDDC